jgi:hypothetical protein
MRFQFIHALWGKQYVDYFINVCLPSLMTTGNFLGFSRYDAECDIYTTDEDAEVIIESPVIRALSGFMEVRITRLQLPFLAGQEDGRKYALMNAMHGFAMDRSDATESVMFFISPDVVLADGTLARARELVLAGKRIVMLGGVKLSSASALEELRGRFNPHARIGVQLTAREVVDLAVRHPHESTYGIQWGHAELVDWPSHVQFPVGDEGHILRGFHLLPLAIYPRERGHRPGKTFDDEWVSTIVPDREDCYVVQDSDEGYLAEFSVRPTEVRSVRVREDMYTYLASWARRNTSQLQWWAAGHPIFVHRGEMSPAWDAVRAESDRVITEVLRRIPTAPPWFNEMP